MSRPTARAVMLAAARGIHARGATDFAPTRGQLRRLLAAMAPAPVAT